MRRPPDVSTDKSPAKFTANNPKPRHAFAPAAPYGRNNTNSAKLCE
jgi:hypothetical protein